MLLTLKLLMNNYSYIYNIHQNIREDTILIHYLLSIHKCVLPLNQKKSTAFDDDDIEYSLYSIQ